MEIRNKIEDSGLIQIDLAQFKPDLKSIMPIDIKEFLFDGLIIKEKDFRNQIKNYAWEDLIDKTVCVYCSTDAIIPTWAYMLISSKLIENQIFFVVGSEEDLIKKLIIEKISLFDWNKSEYQHGKFIIKGCSDIPFSTFAMTELMKILQPMSNTIMFGEPCSTVPVYKKKTT